LAKLGNTLPLRKTAISSQQSAISQSKNKGKTLQLVTQMTQIGRKQWAISKPRHGTTQSCQQARKEFSSSLP
jgi:hypothetical protein